MRSSPFRYWLWDSENGKNLPAYHTSTTLRHCDAHDQGFGGVSNAADSVWCPYKIGDLKEIEKIPERATKLVIKLKNKSYIDRLIYLNLPTLKYRPLQGDMIEVFKITRNIYDRTVSPDLPLSFGSTNQWSLILQPIWRVPETDQKKS